MHLEILAAAAPASGGIVDMAKDTAETFGWDLKMFLSQVVSFVIVALLLRKFAYQPVQRVLEERRQRIAAGLANAEKIKQQLMAKAREASSLEHDRTMAELKRELGRLVVDTTAKVTGKVLNSDDQRRLQEEASRQVAS